MGGREGVGECGGVGGAEGRGDGGVEGRGRKFDLSCRFVIFDFKDLLFSLFQFSFFPVL